MVFLGDSTFFFAYLRFRIFFAHSTDPQFLDEAEI